MEYNNEIAKCIDELKNHWTNFNQTSHKASSGDGDLNLNE